MIRIIFALALCFQLAASDSCGLGWRLFNGKCYSFHEESVTWFDAASTCQVYGGQLVQIETVEKNDWLGVQMTNLSYDSAWAGGTSKLHYASWEWVPGFKLISKYQNWATGEPNNPQDERCLEIKRDKNFKWNNMPCTGTNRYICEKSIQKAQTPGLS